MSGDPFWSNVVFLCSYNGANGATTAVDESDSSHIIGFNNGAELSDTQQRFGATSLDLLTHTSTKNTSCAASADWQFGSGDFTIELWYRSGGTFTGSRKLISYTDDSSNISWALVRAGTNGLSFYYSINGHTVIDSGNHTFTNWTASWRFIAVSRVGNTLYVFLNGQQVFTMDFTGVSLFPANALMCVGKSESGSGSSPGGYIDEVRITKGIGRYSSNFTPPNAPFPVGPAGASTPQINQASIIVSANFVDAASYINQGSIITPLGYDPETFQARISQGCLIVAFNPETSPRMSEVGLPQNIPQVAPYHRIPFNWRA